MTNYVAYAESCKIKQADMVRVIREEFPRFGKEQMSMACNPWRNALQLIPDAEELLVKAYGMGPGLSITPNINKRNHDNKNKPNRLAVRLSDEVRSQFQAVVEQMCFATYQDAVEAAIIEFIRKYKKAA